MINGWVLFLLCVAGTAGAGPWDLDTGWVSYYNGVDGWFAFQGPQRAMKIHPPDFGLNYPFHVESLKAWFYAGMGSWTDSVITYRIYAGDGVSLRFESESLTVPHTGLWCYYGLTPAVQIDSGDFYIAMTYRDVSQWAHPYNNVDNAATPVRSFYGRPGAWSTETAGELCFFAFVHSLATGVSESGWTGYRVERIGPTFARSTLRLSLKEPGVLRDAAGRCVMMLKPGDNPMTQLAPGIYFGQIGTLMRKVIVAH